jgi:hypothetical protein
MADDKSQAGKQDRSRVSLTDDYEIEYLARKFGVTPERVREAVRKVGATRERVEQELLRKD